MPRYRVDFLKQVTDDCGHDHNVSQRTIRLEAPNEVEAVERSIEEFCRRGVISDWSMRADRIEVSAEPLSG